MDDDLQGMRREALIDEIRRLRVGIGYRQALDTQPADAPWVAREFGA